MAKIMFLIRERSIDTAVMNAALYDAEYLTSLGHEVIVVSGEPWEIKRLLRRAARNKQSLISGRSAE